MALHNPHIRFTVVDRDQKRIDAWKGRHLPIHEPGLVDVVRLARDGSSEGRRRSREGVQADTVGGASAGSDVAAEPERSPNLFFTTACTQTIAEADMILISVNTPTKLRGVGSGRATDMTALEGATRDVAIHARPGTILVEKSTVPCKTGQLIKDIVSYMRVGRGSFFTNKLADGSTSSGSCLPSALQPRIPIRRHRNKRLNAA